MMSSIWQRLAQILSTVSSQAFGTVIEQIHTVFAGDKETRRQVAFSVSMIALSAKMAKADGAVTDAEIKAFYEIFSVPVQEAKNVERLYNLAKQDVAGFDHYANRLYRLCQESDCNGQLLEDVLDGLFHIAKADGALHQDELEFLEQVSAIFQFSPRRFRCISSRHLAVNHNDPWVVLGLSYDVSFEEAQKRYRQLVREHHPDIVIGRGLPKEFLKISTDRLAAINLAWAELRKELMVTC